MIGALSADRHMLERPSEPVPNETGAPAGEANPSAPRWVRVFGIVTLLLLFVFGLVHTIGARFHGHTSAGAGSGGDKPAQDKRP